MTIGFASISTTLIINGNTSVSENENEYDIYYSNAKVNGVENKSLIIDNTHIEFTTEIKTIGEIYNLDYYITNGSKNYDSYVSMNCTAGNDYVSVNNTWVNDTLIGSTETKNGVLTLEMIKGYTGDEELTLTVKCEIQANASERDTLGTGVPANKVINLYNLMKSNAKNDVINFSVNSKTSGTNGIYTTTATEGSVPVYYYRGDADKVNNNIIFNNMCWKIIRTTETGGIKLIYNGTPTNGKCEVQTGESTQIGTSAFNTNYNDNAYVGYMYGTPGSTTYEATHANINNSTIKTYIENWFKDNFDENTTNKLEDTIFCNDRSTKAYDAATIGGSNCSSYGNLGYGKNATLYGAAHRSSYFTKNLSPNLSCPQENDKFTVNTKNGNGKLAYPVGLITLDEVILSGFNTYYSNTNDFIDITNYLYTNNYYWTSFPVNVDADGGTGVGYVGSAGNVSSGSVNYVFGVRPVISLSSNTLVTGEGTTTNPYVVE